MAGNIQRHIGKTSAGSTQQGMRARQSKLRLAAALAVIPFSGLLGRATQANTVENVNNGSTDLTASGSYAGGSPGSTNDVDFTNITYSPTTFTLNTPSFNLNIGTLDDLDATQTLTIDNTNGSGTTTITLNGGSNSVAPSTNDLLYVASSGTLSIGTATTGTLNLALGAAGNLDVAGTANIASVISGSNGLTKTGAGTLLLSGAESYTGTTTVNAGTLSLTGTLTSTALAVGGGTFNYSAASGAGTLSFTTGGTSITAGASSINDTVSGDTLNLGAISRTLGGTVDFSNTTGVITTTAINTNGILGGYATFGGNTWAVGSTAGSTTTITGLSSYTTTTAAGTTAANYTNNNIDVTSSVAPAALVTPNSLRFNTAAAETLTLTGTNVINTGGILVTSNVGNFLSTITGGTLEGSSGGDLVIVQNDTSNSLTINSVIADNTTATGLTKSGAGTLNLGNTNTFSGNIFIDAGMITASTGQGGTPTTSNLGSLTATRNITINNGGILDLTSGNVLGTGGSTNGISFNLVINQGGIFETGLNGSGAGWWNKIGAITLNGGTVLVGSGANTSNFQGLALIGTVTVGGTSASTIQNFASANSTSDGIHLGQNAGTGQQIPFSVGSTGAGGADLTVSANLLNTSNSVTASGLIKAGIGTMLLTGANAYTGTTTIDGGALQVGNGTTGNLVNTGGTYSALTFGGTGTINFDEAASSAQTMGALTESAGDGTVQSTFVGTSAAITFSSLAARTAGATANFVTSGGTVGTPGTAGSNIINFTTSPGTGFINQGEFFNGSNYAYYDTAGATSFLRCQRAPKTSHL